MTDLCQCRVTSSVDESFHLSRFLDFGRIILEATGLSPSKDLYSWLKKILPHLTGYVRL